MILMLRVDHRLIHGQVAYAWTNYLKADCILLASDDIIHDELRIAASNMAKPATAKLVIKGIEESIAAINSGVTDKYRLMVIVESVADAVMLINNCPTIRELNLGNIKPREGAKQIEKTFNLLPEEENALKELVKKGVHIFIQRVPEVKAVEFNKI
ncbi:MAG: PTS sugar transporter subunit IIB [Herbinix sp.]|nr:PTS sugar transporter subunit IIB [Herbinix sp.]